MNKGVKKGTRMVYWEVLFGMKGAYWHNPYLCMTKQGLKKFLQEFNAEDWSHYGDIITVKILRNKRIGTTMMWDTETIGYTDVTPQGTLYYIEI